LNIDKMIFPDDFSSFDLENSIETYLILQNVLLPNNKTNIILQKNSYFEFYKSNLFSGKAIIRDSRM